tara:strand:- start:981 stop:2384 length:1404 start_codon:yes stop_codon:yes gene_type:complete
MKLLSHTLIIISCLLILWSCNQKKADSKPNIIYILADDLGYGDLGVYGSEKILTPTLDKMAAEGMRFTNHYAGTAVCAPSRCSLMTGKTMGHSQIRGNWEVEPYGQIPLNPGTTTIATLLKSAGYNTGIIGKWGLGVEENKSDPLDNGFDYFYGFLCQVLAHNHCPEFIMENREKVFLDNRAKWTDSTHWTRGRGSYTEECNQFSQDLFTKKALNFIEENKEDPFFLYLPVIIPHNNGEAPPGKRMSDIPSFEPYQDSSWNETEKGYAAMITYLDHEVGKIFDKLLELDLDENTIVIFTSDNGGLPYDLFKCNGPLKGRKGQLYEGGIRVPMIARWPGIIKPGKVSDHQSAFWDMLPTFCELAGIGAPEDTDGISMVPELTGKPQNAHSALYFELYNPEGWQAVIQDGWKCIRKNILKPEQTTVELYNLAEDISESNDLSQQFPQKVDDLLKLMEQSRTPQEGHFQF